MAELDKTLEPCPFCGGEASLHDGGPGCFFVQCDLCNATSDDGSQDRAIARWNRRASTTSAGVTEEQAPRVTEDSDKPLTAMDRLRLHLHDPETFELHSDDLEGVVAEFEALEASRVDAPSDYVACIACEGSPKAPNDPCGLCGTSASRVAPVSQKEAVAVAEPAIRPIEELGDHAPERLVSKAWVHEGCAIILYGTNDKPIGWIDTHAWLKDRVYCDRLVTPTPTPAEAPEIVERLASALAEEQRVSAHWKSEVSRLRSLHLPAEQSDPPSDEAIASAIRETEYKYFGDYELSENQWQAVFTLISAVRHFTSIRSALHPTPTPVSAPAPNVAWPFDLVGPFSATRFKDDNVCLSDATGHHLAWFNTHTQLPLNDTEGLEKEARDSHRLAQMMADAMNAYSPTPVSAPVITRCQCEHPSLIHQFGKGYHCTRCGLPPRMNLNITKEWFERKAAEEGDHEIGVGSPVSAPVGVVEEQVEAACAKYARARYGGARVWPRDFSPKEIIEGRKNMRAALEAAPTIAVVEGK